ncbi:hypothetical protein SAMN05443254_12037 [Bradyrhizobium sp. OK095]|jgi:hypothetical protein|nr:hypothetical protein SAMN05443254_12037 [Bradyrhizobium sp. OK095]
MVRGSAKPAMGQLVSWYPEVQVIESETDAFRCSRRAAERNHNRIQPKPRTSNPSKGALSSPEGREDYSAATESPPRMSLSVLRIARSKVSMPQCRLDPIDKGLPCNAPHLQSLVDHSRGWPECIWSPLFRKLRGSLRKTQRHGGVSLCLASGYPRTEAPQERISPATSLAQSGSKCGSSSLRHLGSRAAFPLP